MLSQNHTGFLQHVTPYMLSHCKIGSVSNWPTAIKSVVENVCHFQESKYISYISVPSN